MPEFVSLQNFFYLSMPVIAIYGILVWHIREKKKLILRFQERLCRYVHDFLYKMRHRNDCWTMKNGKVVKKTTYLKELMEQSWIMSNEFEFFEVWCNSSEIERLQEIKKILFGCFVKFNTKLSEACRTGKPDRSYLLWVPEESVDRPLDNKLESAKEYFFLIMREICLK